MGRIEGLRSDRVEDDEYGINLGGGEGRDNADELGVGWIHKGELEPRVRDGAIGDV